MTDSTHSDESRPSLWSRAAAAAAKTPETRNRYVDFLRALSIMAVISGHWLVTAAFLSSDKLDVGNLLAYQDWTKWLTWLFQVMPIFFLVGGYANGVSWNAAMRDGRSYKEWLKARLERLIGPVLPLLAVWAVIGVVVHLIRADSVTVLVMDPNGITVAKPAFEAFSMLAIVPAWFLAVYVVVVVLAPVTYGAWKRFGFGSFWALVALAAVDDVLFFRTGIDAIGYFNFVFIWFAVHQLGYAWRDGRLEGLKKTLVWGIGGLALLIVLVTIEWLPYPVNMAGNTGEGVSNSFPPKLPMLALGLAQCGMLLSIEGPMRRWLTRARPWTATLLVNGMIMTIYLWHFSAAMLVISLAWKFWPAGLAAFPGSGPWWAARPLWLIVYLVALVVLSLAFGRFERGRAGAEPAAAWRQIVGASMMCVGLALLAKDGIVFEGWLKLQTWVFLLPILGAAVAGVLPFGTSARRAAK
ncbi:MAG: acyltransferase [Armatimonadetes bacterium]|nr:acyltransferase [Armatimonadota bacterium]